MERSQRVDSSEKKVAKELAAKKKVIAGKKKRAKSDEDEDGEEEDIDEGDSDGSHEQTSPPRSKSRAKAAEKKKPSSRAAGETGRVRGGGGGGGEGNEGYELKNMEKPNCMRNPILFVAYFTVVSLNPSDCVVENTALRVCPYGSTMQACQRMSSFRRNSNSDFHTPFPHV